MTATTGQATTCTMFPVPGERTPCDRKAIARISYGCIHEHCGTSDACERCLENRVLANEGNLSCTRCRNADGHICRVLVTVERFAAVA